MSNFERITAQMKPLLRALQDAPARHGRTLRELPKKGVYVFYEGNMPMYVGRVGRSSKQTMVNRIRQHTNPSSGHNQAVFAFKLLQEALDVSTGHGARFSRAELAQKYDSKFREQKERVRNMDVRAVEIVDSPTQAIFEIYAVLALRTMKYNSFDTS